MNNFITRLQRLDDAAKRRVLVVATSILGVMVFALWLVQVRSIVKGDVAGGNESEIIAGPARVGFTALMESGKYTGRLLGNIWNAGNEYPVIPER